MAVIVEYRDVYKAFDAPVLEGISLEVHERETLSIVGPSGTGKSVLLKITLGLLLADRGDVFVFGRPIADLDARELGEVRARAGYVFQNSALFDSLTVFDNVAMGLPEREFSALGEDELEQRVRKALEEVNLVPDAVMAKLPAELSGGMRKRVGLARAIIREPQLLLYDEPVTGLDPVNAAAVSQLIVQIARARDVCSVVVTHDVEGALEISDRLALLSGGKLRFLGTPEQFCGADDELVRAFARRKDAEAAAMKLTRRS